MRTRLHQLWAFVALALAASGCVIHEHNNNPPPAVPGNVNLVWRFTDGNTCTSLAPFLDHMQVTIPGENLQAYGQFPCTVAGTQGIQLQDFSPGTYQLTVEAVDASGADLYTFTGSFVVNGDVTVDVPLAPVARPGNVSLLWRFTDGNTCASLAPFISHMQVTIPGEQLQNLGQFPCTVAGTQGILLQDFAPGSYTFTVQAMDSTGSYPIYTSSGSFVVDGDVSVDVPLAPAAHQPAAGNVNLTWAFGDGATCSSLLGYVDHVVVTVPGEQLQNAGNYPCATTGTQGIQLTNFAGGSYTVTVDAVDATGASLYHGSGSFDVDGDVTSNVVLARTSSGGGTGTLQIRWGFLDAQNVVHSCSVAGVDNVQVTLGSYSPIVVPCTANNVDGGDFNNLPAGTYAVTLQGLVGSGSSAYAAYTYNQNVVVGAGQNNLLQANLSPLYGSWDLSYNFANASGCNVAGVSTVSVSVRDANNQEISGYAPGQQLSCSDGAAIHWDSIAAGQVTVQMLGYSASGATVRGALVSTDLVAGAANATTVTLEPCGTQNSGC